MLIIIIGFAYFPKMEHNLLLDLTKSVPQDLMGGILIAFIGVFWSMGGWHHATYLSGETIEPQKTVPKAMLAGTAVITLFYLLIIFAYMILLPMDLMASSQRVAGDAIAQVLTNGGKLVTIAIAISIFGTIGIYTMTAPRIYYAMAKDGMFFHFLSDISPKYKTPYKAMLFQAAWASILILLWGSFIRIITFVTFMDIVFMALATATIFVFRSKSTTKHSGYRLTLYPLIPLIYLFVTIAFVMNTLLDLNIESLIGVAILILGIPVFYYFQRSKKAQNIKT